MPSSDWKDRPAVLGQALVGDIHVAKDLQTRGHPPLELLVDLREVVEDAVDAYADAHAVGPRLEMDVGRPSPDGGHDDLVDQGDDRVALGLPLCDLGRCLLRALLGLDSALIGIGEIPGVGDGGHGRGHRAHLHAGDEPHVVDRHHVRGIDHSQDERAVVDEVHRQHPAGAAETLRQQLRRRRVGQQLAQSRHAVHALPGEGLVESERGDEAQLHEGVAHASAGLALVANAPSQLVLGDDPRSTRMSPRRMVWKCWRSVCMAASGPLRSGSKAQGSRRLRDPIIKKGTITRRVDWEGRRPTMYRCGTPSSRSGACASVGPAP